MHDGVEQWQALEYREQLRRNTLSLIGQKQPGAQGGAHGQSRLEIHHTVPCVDPDAKDARNALAKWGVSAHEPADAAIVPANYHRGENVHGMASPGYDSWINGQMERADGQADVAAEHGGRSAGRAVMLNRLRRASDTLVQRSRDPRAISLEGTLRALERPLPRPDLAVSTTGEDTGHECLSGRRRFDLVAVGRPLLQDPAWLNKLRQGRVDQIADFTPAAFATLS